jgi:predicted ATPase/DNA-binding SARP family transcriptional activator
VDAPWRIELLGGLRAVQGERVFTRFRTQKNAELLAYLAIHPGRAHPREGLIELLWPECDLDAGRNRLSTALSTLRHQLEPPGVPAGAVLQADRASVGLNAQAVTTDVAEFEAAVRTAAQARSATERAQILTQALEIYRGPLLPGCYEDWALAEQERVASLHIQAMLQLIRHLEQSGAGELALDYAHRAVAADPIREEAHRELMRLYAASGRPADALRQYQELERILDEELGTTPTAPTRHLAQELSRQSAESSRQSAVGVPRGRPQSAESRRQEIPALSPQPSAPSPSTPNAQRSTPLPAGTVTFLLTDIEGSTASWERLQDDYRAVLSDHHQLLRREFRRHGGHEVKEVGDSFLVAFESAADALACAIAGQRSLAGHPWPAEVGPLRVRMALHTGDVQLEEREYRGLALHRASRILTAAHGGQILCSEATATLLRRDLEPDLRLVDLGVYRLRDVPSPERLFQVEYPGMARREFPPLNAEAGYGGNLPLTFSRFFGREPDLARLEATLRAEEVRLVTLTGPGGTGKTRLALEAARRLMAPFDGSVWWLPLGEVTEADRIPDAAATALRLPRTPGSEPLDQVADFLSRHPSLLVLDNFEQVVAEGAGVVRTLLARVPSLKCLVTSRQRLDLTGEREFVVQPLPRPETGAAAQWAPEQLTLFESVQLFIDRAQVVRPDFQVTPANASAVAELCDRLEGIPLAIELAAARAQVLTPQQMVSQLAHRYDFLVSRKRDVPERQRTLRGAVDWSYRLLSPDLQRLFARVSVFRGGWTLDAAEQVCEEPLALDMLAQLRECSLILTDPASGEVRFTVLETLREYAAEQLEPEEPGELSRRHAECYLALAEQAARELRGPEQAAWLEQLDIEHPNLRAALAWSFSAKDEGGRMKDEEEPLPHLHPPSFILHPSEAGLRLAAALWRFWSTRGYVREGRQFVEEALARVPEDHPSLGRSPWLAAALLGAGALAHDQGDYPAALVRHEESILLWRELGDGSGLATALNSLANVLFDQADYDRAAMLYEEALTLYRGTGDSRGAARVLSNLGVLAHERGDSERAAAMLAESLELRRTLGDQYGLAISLENLGNLERERGGLDRAVELYEEALALRRTLGHKQGIAVSLNNLGHLRLAQEQAAAAEPLFAESLELLRELNDPRDLAECLAGIAGVAASEGRHEQAARLHGAVSALRERSGATLTATAASGETAALAFLRSALGEPQFDLAMAQGRALSMEQAVALARGVVK